MGEGPSDWVRGVGGVLQLDDTLVVQFVQCRRMAMTGIRRAGTQHGACRYGARSGGGKSGEIRWRQALRLPRSHSPRMEEGGGFPSFSLPVVGHDHDDHVMYMLLVHRAARREWWLAVARCRKMTGRNGSSVSSAWSELKAQSSQRWCLKLDMNHDGAWHGRSSARR